MVKAGGGHGRIRAEETLRIPARAVRQRKYKKRPGPCLHTYCTLVTRYAIITTGHRFSFFVRLLVCRTLAKTTPRKTINNVECFKSCRMFSPIESGIWYFVFLYFEV